MAFVTAVLLLALTRAEIVERFQAAPVTMVEGLVQVAADCPPAVRHAYQKDVAAFAAETCRLLYGARLEKPRRFEHPGVLIHLGDVTNRVTNVVSRISRHADGSRFVRVYLPAPRWSDHRALVLAVARGFVLALDGRVIGDDEALALMRATDPDLRLADACRSLSAWRDRGVFAPGKTDEDYLRLMRKVMRAGELTDEEARTFASRLVLLPFFHDAPFCGKFRELSFAEAVGAVKEDPQVRVAAAVKARQLMIFGAGRGAGLQTAADAYAAFLMHLAEGGVSDDDLRGELGRADRLFGEACARTYSGMP